MYVCTDRELERLVAVKTFHDVDDLAALKKEIEGRARIQSKHVAEIYECIYASGVPIALVMEFVPGESLQDATVIPDDLHGKARLLYQVASGIADIHAASVIHRDIKPLNMKVDGDGILKIFDLGISNLDAESASTVGGAGTLVYRAPEVYSIPTVVSTAVDVYALGVVAWHVLGGGVPPALADVPPQSQGKVLPGLASVAPGMKGVTDLLDATLSVNPAGRPDAAAVKEALGRWLVHDRRRGVFSSGSSAYTLNELGTATRIEIKPFGTLRVVYSAGMFVVDEVSGAVFINNAPAAVGQQFPDSSVLTFGLPENGASRIFIPFDVSQPEVVL